MDRYEIAVHFKNQSPKIKAFRFPATMYVGQTLKYIKYAITNKGIMIANNIPMSVLDKAMVETSKEFGVPIVVDFESEAVLFSISHSYKVYSIEKIPRFNTILCYNCIGEKLPYETRVFGIVYGYTGNFKFCNNL